MGRVLTSETAVRGGPLWPASAARGEKSSLKEMLEERQRLLGCSDLYSRLYRCYLLFVTYLFLETESSGTVSWRETMLVHQLSWYSEGHSSLVPGTPL